MIPPGVASFASSLDDVAAVAAAVVAVAASMTNGIADIASRVTNATLHQGARTMPLPLDDWPTPFLPCCMAAGCSPRYQRKVRDVASVRMRKTNRRKQLSDRIPLRLQLRDDSIGVQINQEYVSTKWSF